MSENEKAIDYSSLGLVANPFGPTRQSETDPYWLQLVVHAAVNRLHVAVVGQPPENSKPIVVDVPGEDIPDYYVTAAENSFLGRTAEDATLDALAVNVGIDMMRLGRVRGTLAEVSELVAAVQFDQTLAAWCAEVFANPDTSLEAFEAVDGMDLAALSKAFAEKPSETVAEHFGEDTPTRKEDEVENDMVLREAFSRQQDLPFDPEETPESPEEVPGETTSVMSPPVTEDASAAVVADEEAEEEEEKRYDVASYVIAYTKVHLSPVVARAMRAYVSDGFEAFAQEVKVTKAPKKTLAALIRLVRYRFSRFAVMYDHFDSWYLMDDDLKSKVLGSLQELRWVIGQLGTMVLLPGGEAVTQVKEQFAAGVSVDWSMHKLIQLQNGDHSYDPELVQYWIDSASLEERPTLQEGSSLLAPLVDAADNDILRFASMARTAVDDAAARGLSSVDEAAVERGLLLARAED